MVKPYVVVVNNQLCGKFNTNVEAVEYAKQRAKESISAEFAVYAVHSVVSCEVPVKVEPMVDYNVRARAAQKGE